jgi:hypothetical protein
MEIEKIQNTLQTYTIEEIADHNEILVEDLLEMLVDEYNWTLPNPRPIGG